jgi:hypothetical protein
LNGGKFCEEEYFLCLVLYRGFCFVFCRIYRRQWAGRVKTEVHFPEPEFGGWEAVSPTILTNEATGERTVYWHMKDKGDEARVLKPGEEAGVRWIKKGQDSWYDAPAGYSEEDTKALVNWWQGGNYGEYEITKDGSWVRQEPQAETPSEAEQPAATVPEQPQPAEPQPPATTDSADTQPGGFMQNTLNNHVVGPPVGSGAESQGAAATAAPDTGEGSAAAPGENTIPAPTPDAANTPAAPQRCSKCGAVMVKPPDAGNGTISVMQCPNGCQTNPFED